VDRALSVTWSDPLAAFEEGRKLAPIEHLRAIRDGRLPDPPIARLLGMRLTAVEDGAASFELTPAEQHYNPIGVVHGGIAFTLLDSAMGCAVQTRCPAGKGYTTLELKVNLVRAITLQTGSLRARAQLLHFGSRTATAEGRLEDAAGKLYAHGTSTCLILG
jgi:uncharacterized protein (TIGR00369 family)